MIKKTHLQNGSALIITTVIIAIALVGSLGFIFWQNFINTEKAATDSQTQVEANNTQKVTKIDTSIHEVNLSLETESDLGKLPDYTPDSFKAYIKGILQNNKVYESDIDGCTAITTYQITKISQVNIQGGVGPRDVTTGKGCSGGAPVVWVLTPSGTWDEETLNGTPCKSENDGLIYKEFASECYTDRDTASFIDNPNGSITSINN